MLYVGSSREVYKRYFEHMNNQYWGKEIINIGLRKYPNYKTMIFSEKYYIAKFKPKYNLTGNTDDNDLFISIVDPYKENIMKLDSFLSKFKSIITSKALKPKLTQKEKFINDGWKIIERDYLDLFASETLDFDLDKTAFLHGDQIISFGGTGSYKKRGGINAIVKTLKSCFLEDNTIKTNDYDLLFISIFAKGIKNGSQIQRSNLTKSVSYNSDNIIEVDFFEQENLVTLTKDQFLLDFNYFLNSNY